MAACDLLQQPLLFPSINPPLNSTTSDAALILPSLKIPSPFKSVGQATSTSQTQEVVSSFETYHSSTPTASTSVEEELHVSPVHRAPASVAAAGDDGGPPDGERRHDLPHQLQRNNTPKWYFDFQTQKVPVAYSIVWKIFLLIGVVVSWFSEYESKISIKFGKLIHLSSKGAKIIIIVGILIGAVILFLCLSVFARWAIFIKRMKAENASWELSWVNRFLIEYPLLLVKNISAAVLALLFAYLGFKLEDDHKSFLFLYFLTISVICFYSKYNLQEDVGLTDGLITVQCVVIAHQFSKGHFAMLFWLALTSLPLTYICREIVPRISIHFSGTGRNRRMGQHHLTGV